MPELRIAHRTSPTNIGMGLLSTLAAHDLGYVDDAALARLIDDMLTSAEAVERHEGHLLNWYDTTSLAPLAPRYVSTVDSGNLAGALMALAGGLREKAATGHDVARLCAGAVDTANVLAGYTYATSHAAHIFSVNGFNLNNKLYRNHLSFLKAIAPEVGRGVRVTYTVRFF